MNNAAADHFIEYDPRKHIRLSNINCSYCGRLFDHHVKKTKEHVIGRNFVPNGALLGEWNLILNACTDCNGQKAELENDLSAITMQPDITGRHVNDDELLREESLRKETGAVSRKTGKPVKDSKGTMSVSYNAPSVQMTFGLLYPAQVDFERVCRLAYFHIIGFFFMQTFDAKTRRGGFPLGEFYPVIHADKADWGNDVMQWFMQETSTWDVRLFAITAKEYFKLKFYKSQNGLMAWAVEWNQKTRCIGFWGQPEEISVTLERMPELKRERISGDTHNGLFMRTEKSLPAEKDIMFSSARLESDEDKVTEKSE